MAVLTQNVIQWALPSGDVAQTSMWVEFGGNPTAAQALARFQTNVVDTIWPSGAGGIKGLFAAATILNNVQTRVVDTGSGGVISTASAAYSRAGTGSGNSLPPEVAICVSLRTGLSGGSYRGRMYLPAPTVGSNTSVGRLDTTNQGIIVTQLSNAMIAMNADVTYSTADVVVRSRSLAANTEVTSIDCGDVFDAQRRRRNSLVESRVSAVV